MYAVVPIGDNQAASTLSLFLLLCQDVLHRLLDIGVVLSGLRWSMRPLRGLHELHDPPSDRVHIIRAEPALALGLPLPLSLPLSLGHVQQMP